MPRRPAPAHDPERERHARSSLRYIEHTFPVLAARLPPDLPLYAPGFARFDGGCTHAGAVSDKHMQAYLDEFAFRHNRRKTNGVCRIAALVIEGLVAKPPLTMRKLVDGTRRCRWFRSTHPAAA